MQMCENIYVCVGDSYVYMCVEASMYDLTVCVCEGQMATFFVILWQHLLCSLTQSLPDPATLVGWQAPAMHFCLSSREVLSLWMQPPYLALFCGCWGVNSGSDACMESARSIQPLAGPELQFPAWFWGFAVFSRLWKHKMTALVILLTVDLIFWTQQIIVSKEYLSLDSYLVANWHRRVDRLHWWQIISTVHRKAEASNCS